MSTFPKMNALLAILGLAVAIHLAGRLDEDRVKVYKITTENRRKMVYLPFFGMDKFRADIKWMMMIHELGSMKKDMDEKIAAYFVNGFDMITNLDPDFSIVYTRGVPFVAHHRLDDAIRLMEKGDTYARKPDYERPYLVAHWISAKRAMFEKDENRRNQAIEDAIRYAQKAVETPGEKPFYVENFLLSLIVQRKGADEKPLDELLAWNDYYQTHLQKAREERLAKKEEGPPPSAGDEGIEIQPSMERLQERIVNRCRELMQEFLATVGTESDQELVRKIFAKVTRDQYYSPRSLLTYEPGDLFDRLTGEPVVPYGIDLYDYEVNGRIVPIKGQYNTLTGKRVAATFPELEARLKEEGRSLTRLAAHQPK